VVLALDGWKPTPKQNSLNISLAQVGKKEDGGTGIRCLKAHTATNLKDVILPLVTR
jgi:hypothetical protein